MASIQDQLAAQIDCADVCSMLGAGRKRHLLLSEVVRVLGLRGAGGNSEMLRRACDALGSHLIGASEETCFMLVRAHLRCDSWRLWSSKCLSGCGRVGCSANQQLALLRKFYLCDGRQQVHSSAFSATCCGRS